MLSDLEIQAKDYSDLILKDIMWNGFYLDISGSTTQKIWNLLLEKYNYPATSSLIWMKKTNELDYENNVVYYRLEYVDKWIKINTTQMFQDAYDIGCILKAIELLQSEIPYLFSFDYLVVKTNVGHLQRCRIKTQNVKIVSTNDTLIVQNINCQQGKFIDTFIKEYLAFKKSPDENITKVIFGESPWSFNSTEFLLNPPTIKIKNVEEITDTFNNWLPSANLDKNEIGLQRATVKDLWDRRDEGPDRSIWKALRPEVFEDVVGQDLAVANVRASLLSPWKRHLLFTGPPGVGKTTIARLCLNEIRGKGLKENAPFIEYDCASSHHDEYNRLSDLLGHVHDASYRGSSKRAKDTGIPDIKPGIISQAHGGVLFLDEIGELPLWVQTALLKILEDGVHKIESSMSSESWEKLHDYEKNVLHYGLPANFLMIGATTRSTDELNKALLSRCTIIQFKNLTIDEKILGLEKTIQRTNLLISRDALVSAALNSSNLRDATGNILSAHGFALVEHKEIIGAEHIAQVLSTANNRKNIGLRGNR